MEVWNRLGNYNEKETALVWFCLFCLLFNGTMVVRLWMGCIWVQRCGGVYASRRVVVNALMPQLGNEPNPRLTYGALTLNSFWCFSFDMRLIEFSLKIAYSVLSKLLKILC